MIRGRFLPVLALISLFGTVHLMCPSQELIPDCFTQAELEKALNDSKRQFEDMEFFLGENYDYPGVNLNENDPAFLHFSTHNMDGASFEDNRFSMMLIDALSFLKNSKNLTSSQLNFCLKTQKYSTNGFCTPRVVSCNPATTKFYREDGQCNNMVEPMKGARFMPLIREFDSRFEGPKRDESSRSDSVAGNDVRGISDEIIREINSELATTTGQVLTHEMMNTKKSQHFKEKRRGGFSCCNHNNDTKLAEIIARNKHCYHIDVGSNDPCYKGKVRCLTYLKSMKSLPNCKLNTTPMPSNFHTCYIDAELIYNKLSLAHLLENGGKFDFNNFNKMKEIIVGFDERSGQLSTILLYLSLFVKLHNIVFDEMKKFKGSRLSNEELSFEARKFTTAAYQKCHMDYVINILPEEQASMLANLGPCYNPSLNPQVSLVFNLALRALHYFLRKSVSTYDERFFESQTLLRGRQPTDVPISDALENLSFYQKNRCGITHGALDVSWNHAGIAPEIHCKFFQPNRDSFGTDLRAFDYQTGKENEEPPYLQVLKSFNNEVPCSENITRNDFVEHDENGRNILESRFKGQLHKVPFSAGIDFEDRKGGVLSPTTAKVIANQMKRTACGDRFYFEHGEHLREDQRNRIRDLDFFTIICLVNSCNGTRIQGDPFVSVGDTNRKKACLSMTQILRRFDLRNW